MMEKSPNATKTGLREKSRVLLRWLLKLWPFFVFLIGLGVSYYLLSKDFNEIALIALIAATLLYALVTYLHIDTSRKTAREVRKSRFASLQPIIVMGRNISHGAMTNERHVSEQDTLADKTWLHNVGQGPALNLGFSMKEPSRKKPLLTLTGSKLSALSPGESYELSLLTIKDWKRKGKHDLVVQYEDVFGKRWRSGLELDYDHHLDKFAIKNFFYERVKPAKTQSPSQKS